MFGTWAAVCLAALVLLPIHGFAQESQPEKISAVMDNCTFETLPPPTRGIDYPMNKKALKAFGAAGKELKDFGDRLDRAAKARQELLKNWRQRMDASAVI
jgi:hypothetical protein